MIANFSPGPAAVPAAVRERIASELDDWAGTGTSVMEVSHRGPAFDRFATESEARFRGLLGLADDMHVLFLQGGASTQFALVPLNFARLPGAARYAVDGHWGARACAEGARLRPCEGVARDAVGEAPAAYVHVTSNETVDGLQWRDPPATSALTVCDMSSDICSEPADFGAYDLVYAGAQKNLGIAGLTVVLVSGRALDACREDLPTLLSYRALAAAGSMANTPPTFAWYVFDLVLRWIEDLGGLGAMAERNRSKAARLYAAIDASDLFRCPIPVQRRSRMNVCFRTPSAELDARFVADANAAGLVGLKGHRAVGGLRASLYNAVEPRAVAALMEFLADFERRA